MKKTIYYPPVIRVRRPKLVAPAATLADEKPVRAPYGGTLRRQILGEFTASARKLAGKAR